jgi:hypothetical protein
MLSKENILVAEDELRILSTKVTTTQHCTFEQNAMGGRCAQTCRLSTTIAAVMALWKDLLTTKVRSDVPYRKQLLT